MPSTWSKPRNRCSRKSTGRCAREILQDRIDRMVARALELDIITREEAELLQQAELAREDAIQVDSFTQDDYMATSAKGKGGIRQPLSDPAMSN